MKKHLKALIALMLALACVIACASCKKDDGGDNNGGNGDGSSDGTGNVVTPPESDDTEIDEETYRIRFVYSYTAKVVNDNGRTENKKEVKTVKSMYIPVDNNGLTAAELAEVNSLLYNGYSFVSWHADWDTTAQVAKDAAVDFSALGKITNDMTFYGERGNLAGPDATWEIVYEYPEVEEEEVAPTADAGEEAPEEVAPIGATLYIKGSGKMFDFANGNEIDVKWYQDYKIIKTVVIQDGITSVGSNSFKNFSKLVSVKHFSEVDAEGAPIVKDGFPDSIKVIGDSAFYGVGLKKLTTPKGLETIEKNAFASTALKEVVLNEGIVSLADQAFYGSTKINSVLVPKSLKSIGNSAFNEGAGATNHNLKSGKVFYLGDAAGFKAIDISMDNLPFSEFATIYYYKSAKDAGEEAVVGNFWRYAEEKVTEDKAEWIHPIQYCFVLSYTNEVSTVAFTSISVPAEPQLDENGDTVVVDDEGVPILKGVITEEIYNAHKNLRYNGYTYASFSGGAAIEVGSVINGDINYKCVRGDILSEDGGIKFTLADGVITIYKDSTVEDKIKAEIESTIKKEIKDGLTAAETEGLDEEAIAALVNEKFASEENQAKYDDDVNERLAKIYKIWDFPTITDTGLLWTGKLSGLPGIKKIVIQEGVEYIGSYTFTSLTGVTELTIPASVTDISANAFSGCSALASIYYAGAAPEVGATSNIDKVASRRTKVYYYAAEPTGNAGNYWMDVEGKRIAWMLDLESGSLTIGGDSAMANFESADKAPWYAARDSITSVTISDNIVSLGNNILNGYDKVVELSLPSGLRDIPESSIIGTGIVNDTSKYDKGILIVGDHLLKVDATICDEYFFEMPYGVYTVADGAFAGCTSIKRMYVTNTIKRINPKAFLGIDFEYVFLDGDASLWDSLDDYIDFGENAKVLFKSDKRPMETVVDANGKEVRQYVNGKHWRKIGNEYCVWGCAHQWSDWVLTKEATCAEEGTETRYCIFNKDHTEKRSIASPEHVYGDYIPDNNASCVQHATETARCTNPDCTSTIERDVEVPGVDENGNPIMEKVYGGCNFETYVSNNDRTCTTPMTETAECANGCGKTDTRFVEGDEPSGHAGKDGGAWEDEPYELIENSENCQYPYGRKGKKCSRENCGFIDYSSEELTAADREEGFVPATHDFSVEDDDPKYLASPATKTEPAKYYKSCASCGTAGGETFTKGNALNYYNFNSITSAKDVCTASPEQKCAFDTKESTTTGTYATVATLSETNKALEIGRNSVISGNAYLSIANKNAKTAENAVHVLDTDLMLNAFTQVGDGFIMRIALYNGSDSFFTLDVYKVDDDTVTLKIMADNQSDVVAETNLNIDTEKWYTLRIEYVVGEGEAEKVTITLTDKETGTKTSCTKENIETSYSNASFASVRVNLRSTSETNYVVDTQFYFDDMYLGTVSYADLYGAVAE